MSNLDNAPTIAISSLNISERIDQVGQNIKNALNKSNILESIYGSLSLSDDAKPTTLPRCHDSFDSFWGSNLAWNSTILEVPRCAQEIALNAIPTTLLLFAIIQLSLVANFWSEKCRKQANTRLQKLFVTSLCGCINLTHAFEAWVEIGLTSNVNHFLITTSLVNFLKCVLYFILGYLFYKKVFTESSSLLWIAILSDIVYTVIVIYHIINFQSEYSPTDQSLYPLQLIASVVLFVCLCIYGPGEKPKNRSNLKSEDQSSPISKVFLWWVSLLVKYGFSKPLEEQDLPGQNNNMRSAELGPRFEKEIDSHRKNSKATKSRIKVIKLLIKVFWRELVTTFSLSAVREITTMFLPIFIKYFIRFVSSETAEPIWHGYLFGISIIVITLISPILKANMDRIRFQIKCRMELCLNSVTYSKVLRSSRVEWENFTVGKLLNIMSVDSATLVAIMDDIHMAWNAPLRLTIGAVLLVSSTGIAGFLGLVVWFASVFGVSFVMKAVGRLVMVKMQWADKRIKIINEILNGIKTVKLYAWEECLIEEISKLRSKEINLLRKMEILESIFISQMTFSPYFCLITIYGYQVFIEQRYLKIEDIFEVLTIVELLASSFGLLLIVFSTIVKAKVSAARLDEFLNLNEKKNYVKSKTYDSAILLSDASFTWSNNTDSSETEKVNGEHEKLLDIPLNDKKFKLESLNFAVEEGEFVCIIGTVGSGKSSILSALLGEMIKSKGLVNVNTSHGKQLAYVPQEAWLQNLSLRDNILFGKPYDKDKYNQVIAACELWEDISILPDGDATEIGESGINLSGGQKQRISLARAVYHDADIYLLDDCLSAVDAHVSKRLFEQVLSNKTGLLKSKSRLMVTNKLEILSNVDRIIWIEEGSIKGTGNLEDLSSVGFTLPEILKEKPTETDDDTGLDRTNRIDMFSIKISAAMNEKQTTKLCEAERMESGSISTSVWKKLFQKCSKIWGTVAIIACLTCLFSSIYSRIILVKWSEDETVIASRDKIYFGQFALFGGLEGVAAYFTSLGLAYSYIKSCSDLHSDLVKGVLYTPLKFFDTTPIGRILNRFSKDINGLDMSLRLAAKIALSTSLHVIPGILGSIIQVPEMVVVMFIVVIIFVSLWKLYLPAYRQLKRLESITSSPIYSYFKETIAGATVIRSYQASERFVKEFQSKLDMRAKTYYLMALAQVWREMILSFMSTLLFTAIVIYGVVVRGHASAANIGLLFAYAIKIMEKSIPLISFMTEVEVQLVANERIFEYAALPAEGEFKTEPKNKEWPQNGSIEFKDYSARYRENLDPVLRDISVSIKSKEKIGVVGRTGAGKSSITLALFRIIESLKGEILIDDEDISKIGLFHLRSNLSIIPQDPVIFSGSVRFNLDPFKRYTDEETWKCLELSHLKDYFVKSGQGLDYVIEEGGKNLSAGQKQLMCLARSLLKKPKILIMDEATGSIDSETDAQIQNTIRTEFEDSTMIIIAHRLNTIVNCDRILVLDAGHIAEYDTPENLLRDETSIFYSLAKDDQISLPDNNEISV